MGDLCREHNIDTFLDKIRDLVPFLQIFTRRVRSGLLAHNEEPVRSRTAEAYLRAVGQMFANVGIEDPRLKQHRSIDHRPQRQLHNREASSAMEFVSPEMWVTVEINW